MNRRELFRTLRGVATVGVVGASVNFAQTPTKKYGRLTIDGHRHHLKSTGENLHVYVDGVEATSCYEADDIEGYALVLCQDPEQHRAGVKAGHLHIGGDGHACRMRLTGHVVFLPGPQKGH